MSYRGNCRNLGRTAAVIQAQLPVQLPMPCGAAGRPACHLPSDYDSPFRLWPNDAVPSGLYGHPASARRATAPRGRKLSALLAALLFAASGAAQAKSITALSPSFFDVSRAIGSAVDGDTVIIPAGTATWTSQLVLNKAITLQGQTTTDSVAGTAVDKTLITYGLPTSPAVPLIRVSSLSGKSYRVSGFTFQQVSTTSNLNGCISLEGQSKTVRVDNCHFKDMPHQSVFVYVKAGVYGVADHNVMQTSHTQCFVFYNGSAGSSDIYGNAAWAAPTAWGSANFFFVEDNYMKHLSGIAGSGFATATDGTFGGRFVLRHNHIYTFTVANHGTEGTVRGTRAQEVYGNDFHNDATILAGGMRSGSVLVYNNTWDGIALGGQGWSLQAFRSEQVWPAQRFTGWQGADGSSPWDVNDTEGNVEGHAPHQYWPTTPGTWGAVSSGSSTQVVASDTNTWTSNKWKDYGIKRKSNDDMNRIMSTTNGNTVGITGVEQPPVVWKAGDQYQIHRVLVCLDQSGRGQGDLLTGTSPFINNVTKTRAWPHQVLDPVYGWNNSQVRGPVKVVSPGNTFVENRDYYNQAAAVNGVQQTGVGVGTFANRPASGKNGFDIAGITPNPPGTAYWAADVPSINKSTDKGALYVWRGGAWVLYYQPYTYPHPLTTDLAPPSNLTIVP